MKENEKDLVTQCVIGILTSLPDESRSTILCRALMGALGIVIAGTAKDIYDDKMYEGLGEVVKEFAQREGAREIFNHIFRAEEV